MCQEIRFKSAGCKGSVMGVHVGPWISVGILAPPITTKAQMANITLRRKWCTPTWDCRSGHCIFAQKSWRTNQGVSESNYLIQSTKFGTKIEDDVTTLLWYGSTCQVILEQNASNTVAIFCSRLVAGISGLWMQCFFATQFVPSAQLQAKAAEGWTSPVPLPP